jgi:hypothetical protein
MNLRLAAVGGACCALLAGFSPCLAAKSDHHKTKKSAAPADSAQKAAAAVADSLKKASSHGTTPPGQHNRRASLGGLVGAGQMYADGDYSSRRNADGSFDGRDAQIRFAFAANFRYQMNSWLRWQVSPGFFWVGYAHDSPLPFPDENFPDDKTKEHVLTLVLPVSFQLQWTPSRGPWHYHVGGGPGVYRVWVENRRKVMKDPITKVNHKGFYPGVSGQIGVERFLKAMPVTSIEASIASHWAFATRPDQFPSGFNSSLLGVEVRVGANYYFDTAMFSHKKTAAPAAK